MTSSPSPSELLAIRTANAALLNSPDASVDMVATIVFALGAAGLLASEETRAAHFTEAARLLENTGHDDDAVNLLDTLASDITAEAIAVAKEDPHDSPLHREYRKCRDLPIVPGQQVRL